MPKISLSLGEKMPELPEVETITNDLIEAGLVGIRIKDAKVFWKRTIAVPKVAEFMHSIVGLSIENIYRRGKYIVFCLAPKRFMLVHLRMSGRLIIAPSDEARGKHQHVIIRCQNGLDIRFHDPRKFGRLYWVKDLDEILGRLGPEPLAPSFKWTKLKEILISHKRMIKPLLLDQHLIAGLGNIYVDEALWEACIHPVTPSNVLTDHQIKGLFNAIRKVLKSGLRNRGTALGKGVSNYSPNGPGKGKNQHHLKVFRKHKTPCPRCREMIIRLVVGQRSTHICPLCQLIHRP
jgi:formamidopyrimidine-DNA glycosylase